LRLLYTHSRPVWRLSRTNPDTGQRTTLVESRSNIVLPRVSADGRRVSYFTPVDGAMQIFTVGVDGSDRQQWTFDNEVLNILPDWRNSDAIYYYRTGGESAAAGAASAMSLRRLTLADGRDIEIDPNFHFSTRNWLLAHSERIAFFHHNIRPDSPRTVVRNLADGTEQALAMTISPTDWSQDGQIILGFSQVAEASGQIIACPADGAGGCVVLSNEQGPISGREPRWSMDESRVFFTRNSDRPDYRELWVVDRDGSNLTLLLELGPVEVDVSNTAFGIDHADHVIWAQYDAGDSSEIWMTELR
jgi:hypothetical protein